MASKESRKKIVANWKMHKTIAETKNFISQLIPHAERSEESDVWIAPPFTALHAAVSMIGESGIRIGAQSIHEQLHGAFTGEISALMVKEAGATFTLIGHSERRLHFHESDAIIHKKVRMALHAQLIPILCVGESLEERESGLSQQKVCKQLDHALKEIDPHQLHHLVIAYEPIWAIGTGKSATPMMAEEMHQAIRNHLKRLLGNEIGENIALLYGGSVKPDSAHQLLNQPHIDGVLVGGASLELHTFLPLLNLGKTV